MGKRRIALYHAFHTSLPIMAGYGFLGLTYGIYMHELGFNFLYPMLLALMVYAGSAEFLLGNMLLGSFHPMQAFLMVLMVNARHLFYGLSMLKNIRDWDGRNSSLFSACRTKPLPWLVLPRFRKEPTEDGTCYGLPGSMKPIGSSEQRWVASSVRFSPSTSRDWISY